MKTLQEYINEQFITEARKNVLCFWSHYEPETMNVVVGDPKTLKELQSDIDNSDYNSHIVSVYTNIICVSWNDEDMMANEVGNNWEIAKKSEMNNFEEQLKSYDDDETDFELSSDIVGTEIYMEAKNKADLTPKKAVERVIEFIEESYVDGDSSKCYSILDINKQSVVLKGENSIHFWSAEGAKEMLGGE